MKEGVLVFGTQLHGRIKFEAVCVWGTTRRLPAMRRPSSEKKIQSISKCQHGSCLEESPSPENVSVFTSNCRRYRSCRKANTYHKSIKNQNQNRLLPGKRSDLDRIQLKPACDDLSSPF